MTLNTVTLTWDLTDLLQGGIRATLSLTPNAVLTDATNHVVIPEVQRSAQFSSGTGSLAGIIACDNGTILPGGWAYTLTVSVLGQGQLLKQTVQINFANGATQDLSTLIPLSPAPALLSYLPLPSGTPAAGQVPVATGSVEASAWGAMLHPATLVVAASNASAKWKNGADYVCTGTADNVTINAAMAALPAQGGTVLLSDGQFNIAAAIIPVISNTRLLGQGLNATTVRVANGANCNGYQFDAATQLYNLIFCAIEGITFDGNSASNSSGYGCHVNYNLTHTFWDFYLRDVWFTNWANDGFWSTGGHGYVLDHVLAEFCGGNGINFTGGFTDSPPRIVNGTIKSNTGSGVLVNTVDAYVGHNEISVNSGGGLVLSASGCKAVGNQVRANTGIGVKVTGGSEGHQVIGNTISSNTTHGILLDNANCTITGNFLTNNSSGSANTSDEIQVAHGSFNASGNVITGNVIDGASQSRYGINLAHAGDTLAVLAANRITGMATAQINSLVTDTVLLNPGNQAVTAGGYARPGSAVGWTCPPLFAQASAQFPSGGAGVLVMFLMEVFAGAPSANFNMFVVTAGSVLANVFAAAVDTAGNIVAQTANRAADAALTSNNALWSPPWSSSFTPAPGPLYGCLLIGSATTMPTFTCATNRLNTLTNLGCTAGAVNLRAATTGSGLAALPASPVTMSGISSNQNSFWAALT
jgi:parallel beta-helix repeat protein